jgi:peptide chain release factor 3
VDSAVMVLDAAKGIEEQTRKLFEVCRLRDVPIIAFVSCHLTCVHKGVFYKT